MPVFVSELTDEKFSTFLDSADVFVWFVSAGVLSPSEI